jgi:hypothetical protein
MKITNVGVVLVTTLLSGVARGQGTASAYGSPYGQTSPKSLTVLNWEIAGPIGNFAKIIDQTSLAGVSLEERRFVRPNASLGVSFSWNRFSQTSNVQLPISNGVVSGRAYRYADWFGIRALAHYYVGDPASRAKPYVGFGIGGVWSYAYQQVADLTRSQSNFDFIVDPEVGVLYTFVTANVTGTVNLAFRYTFTTATIGNQKDAQTLSGIVGLAIGF